MLIKLGFYIIICLLVACITGAKRGDPVNKEKGREVASQAESKTIK